ncbi:arginine ABC transporter ATP-binding protein [Labrys miyagiensis]
MPAQDASLHVSGLSVRYRRQEVVREISLCPLPAGTVTALVGPNAAGKSSIMRALAGLVQARGEALLDGYNLLSLRPGERARRVCFMPQALPHGAALTTLEAVIATARMVPATAVAEWRSPEERAIDALDRLGILHLAPLRLDRLSGGQRQLASLAQTIVHEAPLLLLDEPTSALDLRFQFEVMQVARSLAGEGRIAIVVLHDLTLAARWADHVVVLDRGRVHVEGPPAEAINAEMLRSVYKVRAHVSHLPEKRLYVNILGPLTDGAALTNWS